MQTEERSVDDCSLRKQSIAMQLDNI